MLRLVPWLLFLLGVVGCAPTLVEVPPPNLLPSPLSGPSVEVAWPVDARPAVERRDGGYYDTTVPLPLVTYGDINLRPDPLVAVHRAAALGLVSRGIPVVEGDADYTVRVFVLHHSGIRDISDAQWVSTLTGGIAGTVGKFLYPAFMIVDARLRLEIVDRDGRVVAVRDVASYRVKRRPYAFTWGILYLFRRDVVPELFREAFSEVHTDLGTGLAEVVDQARLGEAITAGLPPTEPAQHTLHRDWRRADSFDLRDSEFEDAFARAKYGAERFSLYTGHDTERGEVIGHIGLPIDTFGYEVGVSDRVQAQVDLTVLGLYNGVAGGLRAQIFDFGPTKVSVQTSVGGNVVLLPENAFIPVFAAMHGGGSLIVSHRTDEVTTFAQAGAFGAHVFREFEAFEGLTRGQLIGVAAAPGVEVQLTPTMVLGARLDATAQLQGGQLLDVGPLGPFLLVPRVGLGLR